MSDIEARNAELVAYKEGINKIIYGGEEELRNMIQAYELNREGINGLVRDLKEKLTKAVDALNDVLRTTEGIHACDHLRGRVTVKLMEITGETSGKSLV